MSDNYWGASFDDDEIAVKIKEAQLRVHLDGLKAYALIQSQWVELQTNVTLPEHCELLAVPRDFKPFGSLDDSIQAINERRKPFAAVHLYGGDRLTIQVVEKELRSEFVETPMPSSGSRIPSLLLLIGAFSLAAIVLRYPS